MYHDTLSKSNLLINAVIILYTTHLTEGEVITLEISDLGLDEWTRLISCLLYGLFSVILKEYNKNTGSNFPNPLVRSRGHGRLCLFN